MPLPLKVRGAETNLCSRLCLIPSGILAFPKDAQLPKEETIVEVVDMSVGWRTIIQEIQKNG